LRKEQDVPAKPAALRKYELVKSTGLHLVSGGLLDQPHIWLMQWEVVDSVTKLWDAIDAQGRAMEAQAPNLMAPMRIGRN
jgi:hypothetical protein